MGKRFPYPKRYWIYLIVVFICSVLLFVNIYRTVSWTGYKPFSEFSQRDWRLFFIFLIEEMVILGVMSLCAYLGFRVNKNRDKEINGRPINIQELSPVIMIMYGLILQIPIEH